MGKYLDYDGMLYFWSKLKEKFASIGSAFTPKGSASTIPNLTNAAIGDVYNMSAEFETTTDFVEGDGITYPVGTNIICVNSSGTKKWDVLSGFVNLSGYSKIDHNHNGVYSPAGHTHDDIYYTEAEIDTKLSGKSDKNHTHADYVTSEWLGQNHYTKAQIDEDFATKENLDNLNGTINTKFEGYATNKKLGDLRTDMESALSGKASSNHNHDNTYAPKSHTHAPSQITGAPDAASSEGTPYVLGSAGSSAEPSWVDLNLYYALKGHDHSNATTSAAGFMSKDDKSKLNGITAGATADTAITNSEIDTILAS